jgi:hypothetical protein
MKLFIDLAKRQGLTYNMSDIVSNLWNGLASLYMDAVKKFKMTWMTTNSTADIHTYEKLCIDIIQLK